MTAPEPPVVPAHPMDLDTARRMVQLAAPMPDAVHREVERTLLAALDAPCLEEPPPGLFGSTLGACIITGPHREHRDDRGQRWQLRAGPVPDTGQAREPDYDDTYGPQQYCERRGDRCHTCSKATSTVVPWHGQGQPPSASTGQAREPDAALDASHFARQAAWSARTFGPGPRTAGVLDHIRKELGEIEADPSDLGEWVDVMILAADGAWRAGHGPQEIIDAVIAKQARNEARVWPDWRTAEPGKAIEHDRSASGDTGQAREQSAEHPVTRMERGIRTALFGTDAEVAAARATTPAGPVPDTGCSDCR